jgi:hypothetical protein
MRHPISSLPCHGQPSFEQAERLSTLRWWYSFGTPDYLWLASLLSAKIVSCTNINGYLRNYQDCLTLRHRTIRRLAFGFFGAFERSANSIHHKCHFYNGPKRKSCPGWRNWHLSKDGIKAFPKTINTRLLLSNPIMWQFEKDKGSYHVDVSAVSKLVTTI